MEGGEMKGVSMMGEKVGVEKEGDLDKGERGGNWLRGYYH